LNKYFEKQKSCCSGSQIPWTNPPKLATLMQTVQKRSKRVTTSSEEEQKGDNEFRRGAKE